MAIGLRCVLIGILGYLLGTVSTGYLLGKLYGVDDIRKTGSGNAGTTNMLRTLGWAPSMLTLLGDVLKSFIAAKVGFWVAGDLGLLIGGSAAILGHDFPVFMNFKGGKGIASTLGLILAINPLIAACLFVPFFVIVAITRFVSLGSIVIAILYPVVTGLLLHAHPNVAMYTYFAIGAGALAVFSHRKNIVRLLHHEENRLDFERISKIKAKIQNKKK